LVIATTGTVTGAEQTFLWLFVLGDLVKRRKSLEPGSRSEWAKSFECHDK